MATRHKLSVSSVRAKPSCLEHLEGGNRSYEMCLGLSPAPSSLKGEPEMRAGVKGLAGGRDPEGRVKGGDKQSEAGNVEKPRQDGGREQRGRLRLIPTGDPAGVVGRAPRNCPPGGHAWAVLTAGSLPPRPSAGPAGADGRAHLHTPREAAAANSWGGGRARDSCDGALGSHLRAASCHGNS